MMIVAWTSSQNENLTKGKRDKKMKTTTKILALIGAVGALAATNAFASMQVTLYGDYSAATGYTTGSGGEFRAAGNADLNNAISWSAYSALTSGGPGTYFQTFCAELHEHVSLGTTYNVSSIGNNVLYDGTGSPKPITLGVAYLYSQFAAGTLSGYNYTYGSGRASTAGDLQQAIWTLLGEQGTALASWVTTALTTGLGANTSVWTSAANGAYGVQAMTLGAPGQYQDQLVIVPEASTIIAGALLLLPLGISALRIVRKNRAA